MGFLDKLYARTEKALTASPAVVEAARTGQLSTYQRLGGTNQQVSAAWLQAQSASYAFMYQHQPAVRTVVDYIARNVAQLGLKLYERVSDTERKHDGDHAAAETMRHPNELSPADRFIFNYVADFLVHDNAYAVKFRGQNGSKRTLIQIPVAAVGVNSNTRFLIDNYRVYLSDGTYVDVPSADMIHWRGYNPSDPRIGISRLETLRQVLTEEATSTAASVELYKAGLSKPGYIKRPLDAPEWSGEAQERFREGWAAQMKQSARKSPVLEEGMEFADFGVSPKDAEMLAGREFTKETVAEIYGLDAVPATTEEERKQFYSDVLAPLTQELASILDFSLLLAEYGEDDYYFEFDLNEKLRGDLENRFQAMTSAAGRPWVTVNEMRARDNLPPKEGGDELTVPLNVALSEDEASERTKPMLPAPNVMPPQDPNEPPQDGSHREASQKALLVGRRAAQAQRRGRYARELEEVFRAHYERQERVVVKANRGRKQLDSDRWDRELSDDLEKRIALIVEREGDISAQRLGLLGLDMRQVENYMRATAEDVARRENDLTRRNLESEDAEVVFGRATGPRATASGMGLATSMAAFAALEAGKQSGTPRRKTWVVTADESEHPEMDGESVSLNTTFSNGADGPPADHPGCQCLIEIT